MNVKTGTQTWSKSEQTSSLGSRDSSGSSLGASLGAPDMAKALSGEASVGDVANKIADPNFVETKKVRHPGNANLDKDAFLKLMLTQMKYQDPTDPMKNHEMAAQLAQFSSLEQLNNIGGTLEALKNQQQPVTNYQALNFIGKKVAGDSSKLLRIAGDKTHDFNFVLGNDAKEVEVQVKDADGELVRKLKLPKGVKGANSVTWNGLKEDGTAARPGEYKFVVEAKSAAGTKVMAKTEFDGKITGLNFTAAGPVLLVGTQTIRLSDVKKIYEPSPEEMMMEQMQQAPATPLKAGEGDNAGAAALMKALQAKKQQDALPAASDDAGPKNLLDKNIGMARGLMNDLAKGNQKSDEQVEGNNG